MRAPWLCAALVLSIAGCRKTEPPTARAASTSIVTRDDGAFEGRATIRVGERVNPVSTINAVRVRFSARGEATDEATIPQKIALPLGKESLLEVHVPFGNALASALRAGAASGMEVPFRVAGFVDAEVDGTPFAIPFAIDDAMPRDVVLEHIRRP